jgi:hypothetical protein
MSKPLRLLKAWAGFAGPEGTAMKTETKVSLAAIAIIALFAAPRACEEWSKKQKVEQEKEEKASIGINASVAAGLVVGGFRQCSRVGGGDLDQCAAHQGPLLDDLTASTFAKMAVEQREGWKVSCKKYYSTDYCDALFRRALTIALAKPDSN